MDSTEFSLLQKTLEHKFGRFFYETKLGKSPEPEELMAKYGLGPKGAAEAEEPVSEEKKTEDNVIFVGRKPPMSYVLAVVTQFNGNGSNDVVLKARGRSISTAVDTAEIVRNRFLKNAKISSITIGTEIVTNEEGRDSNVSSIEISLSTK